MNLSSVPAVHLEQRWRLLWESLAPGAAPPSLSILICEPGQPGRAVHGCRRLSGHLEALDLLGHHCQHPHEVACALFFGASTSPFHSWQRPSDWGRRTLLQSGANSESVDRIARLLDILQGGAPIDSVDAVVAWDAKYWILGAPAVVYEEYARQVRDAAVQMTDVAYCFRRLARLRNYGRRGQIFRCPELIWEHELRAHENIACEIDRLRKILASYRAATDICGC